MKDLFNTNMVASLAILLIMISVLGPYWIFKEGERIIQTRQPITGKATSTGTLSITILKPPPDMDMLNLTSELAPDNETVTLRWHDISRDNFSVYITDNISAGFQYGFPNVTGITTTVWNDTNASQAQQRYYKLAVWNTGIENVSNETVGKFDIEILPATSISLPGQVERNLISLPLIPNNLSIQNVFRWAEDDDIVSFYDVYGIYAGNPGWVSVQYAVGQWWGVWSEIDITKAYAFQIVDGAYNLTVVGSVPYGNLSLEVLEATSISLPGQVEFNALPWNSVYRGCNISRTLNAGTPVSTDDIISFYDVYGTYAGNPGYVSIQYAVGQWWGVWDCFEPGRGYAFQIIDSPYNWTYNRSVES